MGCKGPRVRTPPRRPFIHPPVFVEIRTWRISLFWRGFAFLIIRQRSQTAADTLGQLMGQPLPRFPELPSNRRSCARPGRQAVAVQVPHGRKRRALELGCVPDASQRQAARPPTAHSVGCLRFVPLGNAAGIKARQRWAVDPSSEIWPERGTSAGPEFGREYTPIRCCPAWSGMPFLRIGASPGSRICAPQMTIVAKS